MRTPKGKQRGGAKEVKKETNKLRKKAMKNKMMKKTMLTLAGDDTKVNDTNFYFQGWGAG